MDGEHVEKTVLFADIAGSTRLYTEHGDEATKALLERCLDLMEEVVRTKGGHVARRIGDEVLCTFADATTAALCASSLQSKFSSAEARTLFPRPMRLRIGLSHGPIIETDEALYGNTVHTAARLRSLAKAGQTLLDLGTLQHVNRALWGFSRFYDSVVFKGQSGEQEIYELLWTITGATITGSSGRDSKPHARIRSVELEYAGKSFRVDADHPRLEIGRDLSCDLCVAGESVSHVHARVLWDRGRVQLEDVSTNGTLIEQRETPPVRVHRARVPLGGSGLLRLGAADDHETTAVLRFACADANGEEEQPEAGAEPTAGA